MREFIRFARFFNALKKNGLPILISLMLLAGFFDALGVTMFLPILEAGDASSPVTLYLEEFFALFGVELTFGLLLLLLVVFFFLRSLFLVAKGFYVGKLTAELLVELRNRFLAKLFAADYQYYISREAGFFINAITGEFTLLIVAFKSFADVIFAIIFSIIYLAIPLILNPTITLIIVLAGGPLLLAIRFINAKTRQYAIDRAAKAAELQQLLIESLKNYKYLKSTDTYANLEKQTTRTNTVLGRLMVGLARLQALSEHGFTPFVILLIAAILFVQVEFVGTEIAELVFLLFLLRRSMEQVLGIQQKYRKFLNSLGSIQVFETLEEELEKYQDPPSPHQRPYQPNTPIRFSDVTFAYRNGEPVLKNISLTIPPKSTVGFVGISGSGKSTLVTLLTGILQPSAGQIAFGEVPLNQIDLRQLRADIGYVTQESVLFNDTIYNNITLWNPEVPQTAVERALQQASIDTFVNSLPQKTETVLGDSGLNISGGQRQRLTIARELLKQPHLLIFDEATSALDSESEALIQANIDALKGQNTIIIIAHRLSTVKNCDTIFVLDKGRIVEQGTYAELVEKKGEFYRMVQLQNMHV